MQRVYHKWHSPTLGHSMELLEFGHAGLPLIVFPTSRGKFYEYEDRGMVNAVRHRLESGNLHLFCVDSVDTQSWYNYGAHPGARVWRHIQYERYILNEVIPLVRMKNSHSRLGVTGCSFGGFHAVNIALRHPSRFTDCISMSGAYDLRNFLGGYYDENFYFNQPLDFIPNLGDHHILEQMRALRLILATGEHDICLNDNIRLSNVLNSKAVGHWLDVWGDRTGHDWPWWQAMARKFF
ncbi:MAG: alpha/beta hydrolase-fold protein [Armatimonadaceae bacterium]